MKITSFLIPILSLSIIIFLLFIPQPVLSQTNPCLPELTQAQIDAIDQPENGMLVLNKSTGCIQLFTNKQWNPYCNEASKKAIAGTVRYDKISKSFKYFTGEKWISLEEYSQSLENNVQEPSETVYSNGEIIAEVDPKMDCNYPATKAVAGNDLVSLTTVKLNGNTPQQGKGKWKIIKGSGGTITDNSDPKSSFSGTQGVTYTLRWTIATACDSNFDEALVRIRPPCDPEPSPSFAGSNQYNVEVCYLSANQPKSGKGSWIIVSGIGGTLIDSLNPNTRFTGKKGETYTLKWIIRTKCGYTEDDVKIKFKPPCAPKPSLAKAGRDQINVATCKLNANQAIHGNGKWVILLGKGGKIHNPKVHNSTFTGIPNEVYTLKWTISNECGSTSDNVNIKFRKTCPSQITDSRDGKVYPVIRSGDQCWMAKNLDFRGKEHHCYDDSPDNCSDYGALYSWDAAMDYSKKEKSRGVCPTGWHVPTDEEWDLLLNKKDPEIVRNQKESAKFNIVYGGTRYPNGKYFNKREYAFYWSSSLNEENTAWNRYFDSEDKSNEHYSTSIDNSFSVRCVQD